MEAHKIFLIGLISGFVVGILLVSLMTMSKVSEMRVALAGLTAVIVMNNTP